MSVQEGDAAPDFEMPANGKKAENAIFISLSALPKMSGDAGRPNGRQTTSAQQQTRVTKDAL